MSKHFIPESAPEQPRVEYRDIPGFPGYRVGDDGSVWSRRSRNGIGPLKDFWRPLSPGYCRGYALYGLCKDGRRYTRLVHVLVLNTFVGPCPPGMECCHGDGDRSNNTLANLRWDTRKANHADAVRHGTHPRGESHGSAKLTEKLVRAVRQLAAGGLQKRAVARKLGLSESTVGRIVNRTSWRHLP